MKSERKQAVNGTHGFGHTVCLTRNFELRAAADNGNSVLVLNLSDIFIEAAEKAYGMLHSVNIYRLLKQKILS